MITGTQTSTEGWTFVRITHADAEEVPDFRPSEANRGGSAGEPLVLDRLPSFIPLWDPFDFVSESQSKLLLERLVRFKKLLIIDTGYSMRNEGATLVPRRVVEGDDSLGWYLFGSAPGTGLVEAVANHSCANGGSCWLSLFSLDKGESTDLIAPFMPMSTVTKLSSEASGSRRHYRWTTTMQFTHAKALMAFFTDRLLASPLLQQNRRRLTFVLTLSNTRSEEMTLLIGNEHHFTLIADGFFPRPNIIRDVIAGDNATPLSPNTKRSAGTTTEASTTTSGVSAMEALRLVALRYEDRVVDRPATPVPHPPLLVLRIDRHQRVDPIGIVDLAKAAAAHQSFVVRHEPRAPTPSHPAPSVPVDFSLQSSPAAVTQPLPVSQPHSRSTTPPPPPLPPLPVILATEERRATPEPVQLPAEAPRTTDLRQHAPETIAVHEQVVQNLRQQIDRAIEATRDINADLQRVLQATESVAAEHRSVRDQLDAVRDEIVSSEQAIAALQDYNRSLSSQISDAERSIDTSRRGIVERNESVDSSLSKVTEQYRQELRDLKKDHAVRCDQLRESIVAAQRAMKEDIEGKRNTLNERLERLRKDATEEADLDAAKLTTSRQNLATVEAELTALNHELLRLNDDIAANDKKLERMDNAIAQIQQLRDEKQSLESKTHSLRLEVALLDTKSEDLHKQCRVEEERLIDTQRSLQAEEKLSSHAIESFATTQRRFVGMQRSCCFAEEQSSRSEILEACSSSWLSLFRFHHRRVRMERERSSQETAESVARELQDMVQTAQRQEHDMIEAISALERSTNDTQAALENAIVTQEANLAAVAEECEQTIRRIESLRHAAQERFAAREQELHGLRSMYRNLFQEFMIQIEPEVSLACERLDAADGRRGAESGSSRPDQQQPLTNHKQTPPPKQVPPSGVNETPRTATSKSKQPPPSSLTQELLALHEAELRHDDESHWDTCVSLYLQWMHNAADSRNLSNEAARIRNRTQNTERVCLSVAESLAQERRRLATTETELERASMVEQETEDAVRDYKDAALRQRKEMEASIQAVLDDDHAAFEALSKEVAAMETRKAAISASIDRVRLELATAASDLEDLKPNKVELLQDQFESMQEKTRHLENRLAQLRHVQRDVFGLSRQSGFFSIAEATLRGTGISSLRASDDLFLPSQAEFGPAHTTGTAPEIPLPFRFDTTHEESTIQRTLQAEMDRVASAPPQPSPLVAIPHASGPLLQHQNMPLKTAMLSQLKSIAGDKSQTSRPPHVEPDDIASVSARSLEAPSSAWPVSRRSHTPVESVFYFSEVADSSASTA